MPAVSVNVSAVLKAIESQKQKLAQSDSACLIVAKLIRDDILKKTRSGVDYAGTNFKPYSGKYVKIREENHRAESPVTLMYRNHMLTAMYVERIRGGAAIRFNSELERRKARAHNEGLGKLPKRRFFDLSKSTKREQAQNFRRILSRMK